MSYRDEMREVHREARWTLRVAGVAIETGSLTLTRRPGEFLVIGDDIVVKVMSVKGSQVKLQVVAPKDVSIHRHEIYARVLKEREAQQA